MKCIIIIAATALSFTMVAQVPYWKLNGNPTGFPVDAVNVTNNFLGTDGTNNTFLKIGVQGSQDIMIDNDNTKLLPADASGRLHGGHWIGMGRVFTPTNGIGLGAWAPKAHLHIDGGNNTGTFGSFGNGLRPWMNTGTLYTENSDAMYVGLRNVNNFISYAVINWSDDAGGNGGSDYLSFNFTGNSGGLLGPTATGMELGRFNPTTGRGTLGVGNFQFIGIAAEPVRRLEILDAEPSSGINTNTPQLRTTYTYNTTPTGGVFTEFQTTSNGDMYFNTRSNTVAKNFGFHKFNPQNCVEITSHTGNLDFGNATNGSSGLRFTNLKSSNTPKPNPGTGVLSVDANGDVIYVPVGGGLTTGNNGVTVTAGAAQLGVPCSIANIPAIVANQFTTDRIIANRNQNLWIASLNNETGGMGVGGQPVLPFCNLGNTFEISANSKNTQYGTAGSGLRFTKLTSSSATIPNGTNGVNSTKVLTVDGDGDVVLTDAGGTANANNGTSIVGSNVQLGQNVAAVGDPGKLLNNRQVPMYGKNIYFTGQDTISKSSIYIGYTGNDIDQGKLNVKTITKNLNITTAAIKGINRSFYNNPPAPGIQAIGVFGISDTLHTQIRVNNIGVMGSAKKWYPIGVLGTATDNQSGAASIGVRGEAFSSNGINIGGHFSGTAGTINNTGVSAIANGASTSIGVRGQGNGTVNSYGGYFFASGATRNYAIYADVTSTSGNTPPTGPDYAGYFNGDVYIAGSFGPSDQNLKEHIDTITNALNIIKQLKPKSFDFKHTAYPSMNLPTGKQFGLIAQEVETILPELVNTNTQPAKLDSMGNVVVPAVNFKGLEYQQLIPFLIKGMQEQQTKIDSLTKQLNSKDSIQDARLTALENAITQCCSNNSAARNANSNINQLDVELSDKDAIVLNQNVPNPFAEQTTITYNVPVSVTKAQIIFYNGAGQIIQTVDITTRGKGKVNVFANDLSSGLYHYTLVADGKVVDSKKMVRE